MNAELEVKGMTLKTLRPMLALTLCIALMNGCGGGGSNNNSPVTSTTLQMTIVGPESVWSDQTGWTATAQVTTANAGSVTYTIDAGTTGLQIDSASGVINAADDSPTSLDAGQHTFTVTATSDSGASRTGQYSITSKVVLTGHLLQSGSQTGMTVSREGLFTFSQVNNSPPDFTTCLGEMTAVGTELSGTVRCKGGGQTKDESYSFVGIVVEHASISFTSKIYVDGPNAGTTSTVEEVFEYTLPISPAAATLNSGVFATVGPIFVVIEPGLAAASSAPPIIKVTNTHVVRLGTDGAIEAINASGCQTSGALHPASLVNWAGIGDATITNSNCQEADGVFFLHSGILSTDPSNLGNFFFSDINQVALPSLVMAGDIYMQNNQAPSKGLFLLVPGNPDSNNNFNIEQIVFLRVCDNRQQITPIGINSGWNSCEEFLSSID